MIEFKESDYTNINGKKCLSYDAVFLALEDMMYEARNTNGLCNVSVRNDGRVYVDTKRYDVYETLRVIVNGMEKGTQVYEERLKELEEIPFV